MTEYINRKDAIEMIKNDLPEVVYYRKEDAIGCLECLPLADVVPRAEIEDLKKKLEETEEKLMNVCLEKSNCDEMIQYILDFNFRRRVIDVFDEIEQCVIGVLEPSFQELRKKYTEER